MVLKGAPATRAGSGRSKLFPPGCINLRASGKRRFVVVFSPLQARGEPIAQSLAASSPGRSGECHGAQLKWTGPLEPVPSPGARCPSQC